MQMIMDWSEVWALLIPLAVLLYKKPVAILYPVVWYVGLALMINIALDSIWKFGIEFSFSSRPGDNTFLYKTHSIVRFILFSWFFIHLHQSLFGRLVKMILALFVVFVVINFSFFESFESFNYRILSVEAGLLILNCLIYYFNIYMQDQPVSYIKNPAFWVTTGLSVYTVINFPVFLFYTQIGERYPNFGVPLWTVHNISFIVFCIFLAYAFSLQPVNKVLHHPGKSQKNLDHQPI